MIENMQYFARALLTATRVRYMTNTLVIGTVDSVYLYVIKISGFYHVTFFAKQREEKFTRGGGVICMDMKKTIKLQEEMVLIFES
jgi:hypothetical protein